SWYYLKLMQWELAVPPEPNPSIALNPGVEVALCNRGFAFYKKAQWEAAILDLDKVYAVNTELNRASWNREWAIHKQEQWDLVISDNNILMGLPVVIEDAPQKGGTKQNLDYWFNLAIADYAQVQKSARDEELIHKAGDATKYINNWLEDMGWE
ncbi:MAG TPA: hypothetical protein VJ488_05905, partial [Dehalococcoidia bacterium]|nr:hypothetical protein [Dehalococcoidia bacterium]